MKFGRWAQVGYLVLGPLLKEEDEAIIDLDLIPSLSCLEEVKRFQAVSQTKKRKIKASQSGYRYGQNGRMVGESL